MFDIDPEPAGLRGPYFIEYSREAYRTRFEARCAAGALQASGQVRRSIRIFRNGVVVDLKRF